MKRLIAALLSFILIIISTIYTNTVQASGNGTSDLSEGQYTRVGEDYDILDENVLLAKKDGTVWGWHITGTVEDPINPSDTFYKANLVQIPGLQDVKQIVVERKGNSNFIYTTNYVALKKDGTVSYWDAKSGGTLRTSSSTAPSSITGLTDVISIAANFNVNYDYKTLFALKSDGSVWFWGSEIGDSGQVAHEKLLDDVMSIKSMGGHVYVVKKDGSVWSWNAASFLPYNLSKNKGPEKMEGLSGIVSIQLDIYTNYAYKLDGTVWSWPRIDPHSTPIQVHTPTDTQFIIQFNWNQDPNIDKMYAFRGDDQLWSVENGNVLPGLSDIVSVHQRGSYAATRYHYALKKDQTLWAWGDPSSALPKLVVFTKQTVTGTRLKPTDKPTDNGSETKAKPTTQTSPEISLYPFVTMLEPGEKQFIAAKSLQGTKVTYTIDDPSIGTLSSVNGIQILEANRPGQTIVRATSSRVGFPDVTSYFMLYVFDSKMLSETYFTAIKSIPAADKKKPFIVEGVTEAGELMITKSSNEKLMPVNGQFVLTTELMNRIAGNALKAKSTVEQTLENNEIVLARKLTVNGEVSPISEQNEYTLKLYKDSLVARKDLDYITFQAGDAKLMVNLATADDLFHSLQVIVIRLVKENNGGYRVQFLNEQGQELSNVSSNIRLILPMNDTDAVSNSVFFTNGEITQPIGGKFNPNKNGMEVEINRSGTYFLYDNFKSFPDVENRDPELKQAVQFLSAKGIVNGKDNGNFEPDSLLTRAEFTAMLVRAFYALDETATESFSDVHKPQWHVPFIASSEKKHIVEGYPDGTFRPDHTISRQEMTAIGARSLHEKKGYFYPSNTEDYLSQFIDQETISNWAKPTMALAVKQRLIDDPADKQIRAREAVTRGEAARMLYRLYLQL
ncbi:S-layer homology domain-containing protein [Paenibacillus sp. GSMTC-2017]|uniref:S-layer homology domain-containing protein n=1 Tax=Paenibacillus sp. GSMTC-2017 TaxID=2794350 RepID=UPI0018D6B133|nr:S-layer homology domain-containing protein [Paenibacillus sp. GSMTC-2017]MBH5319419.1 S-layer homology domain-containing protein [Paenibacillus sp. GSMTC-2017]